MSMMFRCCTLAETLYTKKRDDEKRGRSKQLSQEAITLLSEKRKAGSGCFWVFFPLLSSASSTAAAGDPAHTSLNIPHLAPTPHGASSFAHQPLRCCRTTTSSATWLTDRRTEKERRWGLEGWAPPAATQKAESLKSTPRSCVSQTLEVTIPFYITRRTSSSHFCAGACDGNMVSLLKGYPRVTTGAGCLLALTAITLLERCAETVIRRAVDGRVTWKHLETPGNP